MSVRVRYAPSPTGERNVEIHVMKADGSSVTRLTNNPAADGLPAWSR